MSEHELEQMQRYEDECYEEELTCRCGGEMDTCIIGDEVYYKCKDCGLGEVEL